MSEVHEQNNDVRVVEYKSVVEIGEAEERLNLLDCFGGQPFEDQVNF